MQQNFEQIFRKQETLDRSLLVFLKLNYWGLIVWSYFPHKDSVGHNSDWFMFLDIEFRLVRWNLKAGPLR